MAIAFARTTAAAPAATGLALCLEARRTAASKRAAFASALICGLFFSAPTVAQDARLIVKVVGEDGERLPCRAWVDAGGKRLFEPVGPSSCTPYGRDRSFSCDGIFEIAVPPGPGIVHVERGKEYATEKQPYAAAPQETVELTVLLRRWIDMPTEGWYSADMHVHFGVDNPAILRQLAAADDVHVTPVFTYWLRGTESSWQAEWPAESFLEVDAVDANHIVTRRNVEIERIRAAAIPGGSIGASFLFNLRRPVTAARFGEHFPADTSLCLAARAHSPDVVIDTDKPSWAETVVGAALGVYDTVQVCHNHYHREQTIPGGWGMIGPLATGESNAVADDGLFQRTNNLYYRFLNCGIRLGVSGGSAIGVMAVPMGYNRVYARIDGASTAEKYWAAVKSGRSFATSGPMLTMTANDEPLGATIPRGAADEDPLRVVVRLRSADSVDAVQLVHDGKVVEESRLAGGSAPVDVTLNWSVVTSRSGWVAARALFRAPDGRLRQAHVSPIYIEVDKKPIARRDDAEYMLRWIDRLIEVANRGERFPTAADRRDLLEVYQRAQAVYRHVALTAAEVWKDGIPSSE